MLVGKDHADSPYEIDAAVAATIAFERATWHQGEHGRALGGLGDRLSKLPDGRRLQDWSCGGRVLGDPARRAVRLLRLPGMQGRLRRRGQRSTRTSATGRSRRGPSNAEAPLRAVRNLLETAPPPAATGDVGH
jgi:hypothetical protein